MSSSVGILNRTHDNLEKRIARIEAQLGRPRSCKYGTTAERLAYAAPVEGILWWDTTEEVLYVWYDSLWTLAKGIMVGTTAERMATSLPTAGGMWWDTTLEQLFVWGLSNSWNTVTGAKYGTREQRDTGGFAGCVWMCTDEGFAYAYHPSGHWVSIGDSVVDFRTYFGTGVYAIFGNRTTHTYTSSPDDKPYDVYTDGRYMLPGSGIWYESVPTLKYGQDGLVPYVDFSNTIVDTYYGGMSNTGIGLRTITEHYTIMLWFKLYNYAGTYYIAAEGKNDWIPQPLIGYWRWETSFVPGGWILWIMDKSLYWGPHRTYYDHPNPPYPPYPGGWAVDNPAVVHGIELNKWHLAIVRDGYVKLDDGDWSEYSYPVLNVGTSTPAYPGRVSFCISGVGRTLDGRVSMYYATDDVALTDAQISFYYERTRRLHGV